MASVILSGYFSFPPIYGQTDREPGFALDRRQMEAVEELTETLANRLLDLAIACRGRDRAAISQFFKAQVVAFSAIKPSRELKPGKKWLAYRDWRFANEAEPLARDRLLDGWLAFLDQFRDIEDVRFKVKESVVQGTKAQAKVFFFLVGLNRESKREWARGYLDVQAELESSGLAIGHFQWKSLASMIANRRLFTEVGIPAGMTATYPQFGSKRNHDSYWRGAAAADVNLDGLIDVFAVGLSQNYLYLNLGSGRFRNAAGEAWIRFLPPATAPLFLDYDNDGDPDLFLSSAQAPILLENRMTPDGRMTFRDVSLEAGVSFARCVGFSAVAGDVNRDGFPDIYLASYNHYGAVMPNSWHRATNGTANLLFINDGKGQFVEAASEWGVDDRRWSYAAQFADFDEDGDLDLYVANDFGENGLYLNEGNKFRDIAASRGVLDPGNGMGVSFGDYDNDGDLDLHVTNMSSTAGNRILRRLFQKPNPEGRVLAKLASGNSLFENIGDGQFKNVTEASGGFSMGWAWGGGFIDFDNDGWQDIYTPNGFISGTSMKDT